MTEPIGRDTMNIVQQAIADMQVNDTGRPSQITNAQASQDTNSNTNSNPMNTTPQVLGICQHCGNHCGHNVSTTPPPETNPSAQAYTGKKKRRHRKSRPGDRAAFSFNLTYLMTLSTIPITDLETISASYGTTLPKLLKTIEDKYYQRNKLSVRETQERIEGLILEIGDGEQLRVGFDNVKAESRHGKCAEEYFEWFNEHGRRGNRATLRLEICLAEPEMDGSKAETSTESGVVGSKDGGEVAKADQARAAKPNVVGTSDVMAVD